LMQLIHKLARTMPSVNPMCAFSEQPGLYCRADLQK
jgi:hypothetical protein